MSFVDEMVKAAGVTGGMCGCGMVRLDWAEENLTPEQWAKLEAEDGLAELCDDACEFEESHGFDCECGLCRSRYDQGGAYSAEGEFLGRTPCGCEDAPCCGCGY